VRLEGGRGERCRASAAAPERGSNDGLTPMQDTQRQTHQTISDKLSLALAIIVLVAFITFELTLNHDRASGQAMVSVDITVLE
jgi:hypothetical protein